MQVCRGQCELCWRDTSYPAQLNYSSRYELKIKQTEAIAAARSQQATRAFSLVIIAPKDRDVDEATWITKR